MLDVQLVVVGGDAKSAEIRLKLPTVIGRGKEANLTVPHALVSRRHTEIFEQDGRLMVRDLGSLNGTFVNNSKIDGAKVLEPNQLLTLGNITFRAVYSMQGVVSAPAPECEEVIFDEPDTEEAIPHPPVKIDFNETVPLDELKGAARPVAQKRPIENEMVKSAIPESSVGEQVPAAEKDVLKRGIVLPAELAVETNESFEPVAEKDESTSDVFSFDEKEAPSESVAFSALEELPPAKPSLVSFVDKVKFGDDAPPAAVHLDSIEIDLGENQKMNQIGDDSSLGSFLKKLPK